MVADHITSSTSTLPRFFQNNKRKERTSKKGKKDQPGRFPRTPGFGPAQEGFLPGISISPIFSFWQISGQIGFSRFLGPGPDFRILLADLELGPGSKIMNIHIHLHYSALFRDSAGTIRNLLLLSYYSGFGRGPEISARPRNFRNYSRN